MVRGLGVAMGVVKTFVVTGAGEVDECGMFDCFGCWKGL